MQNLIISFGSEPTEMSKPITLKLGYSEYLKKYAPSQFDTFCREIAF